MTRQTSFGGGELAVILPGTWAAIPLDDPEAASKRISALVKSQVGRSDRLARVRRDVKSQLEGVVADARSGDVFSLALSMEILPGVPFPAAMSMSKENWPIADDPDSEVSRIVRAYPQATPVELSIGTVARSSRVTSQRYDEQSAPELVVDYRFPAPGGEHVIRVHVNAPMAYEDELYLELFDAIVDSITFREPLAVAD